jgi:hypothetical protein
MEAAQKYMRRILAYVEGVQIYIRIRPFSNRESLFGRNRLNCDANTSRILHKLTQCEGNRVPDAVSLGTARACSPLTQDWRQYHSLRGHVSMTRLFQFVRFRVRLVLLILALLACSSVAASPLLAQAEPSLGLLPSITTVGTNDNNCHESVRQLQRLIGEFAFVRGHRIYVVCDSSAWQIVLHHLTLTYGVIVNSRAAISDIRLRETWFYARALRKGAEGHGDE